MTTLDAFEEVQRANLDLRERNEELGRELVRLRAKNARYEAALDDAAIALENIVADEAAEGNRNSGPAQMARSGARTARDALREGGSDR